MAAALTAVLVLTAGCAATEWPSDADLKQFCEDMTGPQLSEDGIDQAIRERGTPENLPFEARRYLIHLDEDKDPVPGDQQVLEDFVADNC